MFSSWKNHSLRFNSQTNHIMVFSRSCHNLEVSLDIINLGSNAYRFVPNQSDQMLRFEGLARTGNTLGANGEALPVGTPLFSYKDREYAYQYSYLLSRMQMQLGIRYSF
ncbi:MAG: hypothetical protein ACKO5I_08540 [Ignavibacteria bacterium]